MEITRVLLIDDEEDASFLINRLLQKVPGKKFQVDWAPSYDSGLDQFRQAQHDVYLVDFRLGGQRNGLNFLSQAISLGAQAPIILLTGEANPQVDMEATQLGAADFIPKDGLTSATLERSIRYAIQQFKTMQALQKSHERFRLLFEGGLDATFISDDAGNFLEVNGAACALLGQPREKLLTMKMKDFFSPKNNRPGELQQSRFFGELNLIRKDGTSRFAEFSTCRFAPNLNLNILRDVTERRNLEQEIAEISEKEQRRLGQDLHDSLGQTLTAVSFLTTVLHQKLTARNLSEAKDAADIVAIINQTLTQTRDLAKGLCPPGLEKEGIGTALNQLSENLRNIFGVSARVEVAPNIQITDTNVATHLYRIAQEATTNAIKHGQAKKITIQLAQQNGQIVLQVKDKGVGFSGDQPKTKGMGLRGMQDRARMIGATLDVTRAKNGGTVVTCSLAQKESSKISLRRGRKNGLNSSK